MTSLLTSLSMRQSLGLGLSLGPAAALGRSALPYPLPNALIDVDFLNWRATDGANGTPNEKLTFSHSGTTRTRINADGDLEAVDSGVMRRDYRFARQSLLIEQASTQKIRNSKMAGVVAGTPGSLPTNWTSANGAGLTRTISGPFVVDGITCIDIRYVGTTSDGNGLQLAFEGTTQIVAADGELWSESVHLALVDGSAANINYLSLNIAERTSTGSFVSAGNADGENLNTLLTPSLERFRKSKALSGGGTVARVQPRVQIQYSAGVAIDITLRFGLPQMESISVPTSEMESTSAEVARNAEQSVTSIDGRTSGLLALRARKNIKGNGVYACLYSASGSIKVKNSSNGVGVEVIGWDGSTVDNNVLWPDGSLVSLVVAWSGNKIRVTHEGAPQVQATLGASFEPSALALGHDWDGAAATAYANTNFERVAVTYV